MAVLNIYSLDDTENQNIIASLPEGKHVIGRGDILQVTDKRVSRKHAVIEVSSDKVLLTSIHINPCFFKAANGKILSVLSQNQQSELNDGDQFALLPENYWFKVKITKENLPNGPTNGLNDAAAEINGKRHHDENFEENGINSDSKRARVSLTSLETSIHNADNCTTAGNIALEITNCVQNSEASHNRLDNQDCKELQEKNAEKSNTSLNKADTENNENVNIQIKVEHEENKNEDLSHNTSHNVSKDNRDEGENKQIKEDPKENDFGDASTSTSHSMPENDSNDASTSHIEIKEEPSEHETPPQNNDNSNDQQPKIKTENTDDDNQNKDGASGSETGAKKVRRERCWYGDRCFRKNPHHRDTFSHPGDQDYDSDPDDDRPDCPYGATCYRKNIDHRREYKHVGKPAPKPSNVNVTLNVSSGCSYCEHCNRKWGGGGKPDYESDVDDDVL